MSTVRDSSNLLFENEELFEYESSDLGSQQASPSKNAYGLSPSKLQAGEYQKLKQDKLIREV